MNNLNNYPFARKPTETETPTKKATVGHTNEEKDDSVFHPTQSDESTPAPTQNDNEAKGTSTTERQRTESSTGDKPHTSDFGLLNTTNQLNRCNRMMYIPLQFTKHEKQTLLDTGAIQRAMWETEYCEILTNHHMPT